MYYFVVNPSSSSGNSLHVWYDLQELLDAQAIPYRCYILDHEGEAREIGLQLSTSRTPCTVIVLGGDGTVSELLDGMPCFDGITLAYIPSGSGNDFARALLLPTDPEDAMDTIIEPDTLTDLRIGSVAAGTQKDHTTRSFAVSCGMGFDAQVCYDSAHSRLKPILNRLHMGRLVYLLMALRTILKRGTFSLRLMLDDSTLESFDHVLFATVMNTAYEGGGFKFCPKADPTDEYLDILLVDSMPTWKILLCLPTAFFGLHTHFKGVHMMRCKKVVLQADKDQCVHTDGEHLGFCRKITCTLRPDELHMIAGD